MRCPTPYKKRYRSRIDALLRLARIHSSPREQNRLGYECRAYECVCGSWHLTSQPETMEEAA